MRSEGFAEGFADACAPGAPRIPHYSPSRAAWAGRARAPQGRGRGELPQQDSAWRRQGSALTARWVHFCVGGWGGTRAEAAARGRSRTRTPWRPQARPSGLQPGAFPDVCSCAARGFQRVLGGGRRRSSVSGWAALPRRARAWPQRFWGVKSL